MTAGYEYWRLGLQWVELEEHTIARWVRPNHLCHRQSLFLEWRRFEVIFRIQQQSYIYKVSNSPSTVVDMRMSSHAAVCESSNNGIETGLHDSHGRVIVRQTAGSEILYDISIPAPAIHTRRGA